MNDIELKLNHSCRTPFRSLRLSFGSTVLLYVMILHNSTATSGVILLGEMEGGVCSLYCTIAEPACRLRLNWLLLF